MTAAPDDQVAPPEGERSPAAPEAPDSGRGLPPWMLRARQNALTKARQAETWVSETDQRRSTYDLAVAVYERDRETFASVLGSAIALRLFLFTTSLAVAVVGALNLVFGEWGSDAALEAAGVTGEIAAQVGSASQAQTGRDLGFLLSGLFFAFTAGRTLTKVLSACSAGAWRIGAREAKATVRVMARVTALVALVIIAASGLNRLRDRFGVAVATGSLTLNVAILAVGWFLVTLSLPRPTRDPGAMLPGAAVFAVLLTLVQWFMHFYLPHQIENASETMGSLGFAVATLGYLFLIGRLMAGTIVLNAVLWERFGSISGIVFRLPVLRRLPARFPRLAEFFDLESSRKPLVEPLPEGAEP